MSQPAGGVQIDGLPETLDGIIIVPLLPRNHAEHKIRFQTERITPENGSADAVGLIES